MVDGVKGTGQVSVGKTEVEDSPQPERRATGLTGAAADAAPLTTRATRKAPPPSLAAQLLSAIEDLSAIDAEENQSTPDIRKRRFEKKEQIKDLQWEVKTHMTAEREVFLAFKAALKADPEADLSTLEDQFQSDAEQQIFATFLNAMDHPDARAFFADKTRIMVTPEESAAHDTERERLEQLGQEVRETQFDEDRTEHLRLVREHTQGADTFRQENDRLTLAYDNESDELRNFQTEILGQDGASLDRRKAMATHFFQNSGGDYNIEDFRPPEEETSPQLDRPAGLTGAAADAAAGALTDKKVEVDPARLEAVMEKLEQLSADRLAAQTKMQTEHRELFQKYRDNLAQLKENFDFDCEEEGKTLRSAISALEAEQRAAISEIYTDPDFPAKLEELSVNLESEIATTAEQSNIKLGALRTEFDQATQALQAERDAALALLEPDVVMAPFAARQAELDAELASIQADDPVEEDK